MCRPSNHDFARQRTADVVQNRGMQNGRMLAPRATFPNRLLVLVSERPERAESLHTHAARRTLGATDMHVRGRIETLPCPCLPSAGDESMPKTHRALASSCPCSPSQGYHWDQSAAGGALLDVGCYPLAFALACFGGAPGRIASPSSCLCHRLASPSAHTPLRSVHEAAASPAKLFRVAWGRAEANAGG